MKQVSVPLWGELCGMSTGVTITAIICLFPSPCGESSVEYVLNLEQLKELNVSVPLWGELCGISQLYILLFNPSRRVSVPLWGELCGMVNTNRYFGTGLQFPSPCGESSVESTRLWFRKISRWFPSPCGESSVESARFSSSDLSDRFPSPCGESSVE